MISVFKRIKPDRCFTIVPNELLEDKNLSWRSKGILCYLLSKPETWQVRSFNIEVHGADSGGIVQLALLELRREGYAQLRRVVNKGKVVRFDYLFDNRPSFEKSEAQVTVPEGSEPEPGKPELVEPDLANRPLSKTEESVKTEKEKDCASACASLVPCSEEPGPDSPTAPRANGHAKTPERPGAIRAAKIALPFSELLPEALNVPEFKEAWGRWNVDRKARRTPVTLEAARMQLAKLEKFGLAKAIESINLSIENGWRGLFEPRPELPKWVANAKPTAGQSYWKPQAGETPEQLERRLVREAQQ